MRASMSAHSACVTAFARRQAQIHVELRFGFEADHHAVDETLPAHISEAKIGGEFAPKFFGEACDQLENNCGLTPSICAPIVHHSQRAGLAERCGYEPRYPRAVQGRRSRPASRQRQSSRIERHLQMFHLGAGNRFQPSRDDCTRRRAPECCVPVPLQKPLPDGAVEGGHVAGTVRQKTIDAVLPKRRQRLSDWASTAA